MTVFSFTLTDMNDLDVSPSTPAHPLDQSARRFVYAVARRIVGSANDAEDVTQDALLLAHRHRAAFRGDAKHRTWLYRIAATTAISFLRRRSRSREQLAALPDFDAMDDAQSPADSVVERDAHAFVQRAVAALEPKYREVLLCRAARSESETAAALGISLANVKVRAHRARAQLRDALEPVR